MSLTLATFGQAAVARIPLFGSHARGASHPDSDLAEEAQLGREGLPHLRPILIAAGERPTPALLRAMTDEGIVEKPAEKPGPDHETASVVSVSTALSYPMTGFHR